MRILILFFTLFGLFSAHAEESWWWSCKQSDLILRGKVTYDPKRYFKITPPPGKEGIGDVYYLSGSIKIEEVLYANLDSQFADNYRLYLRSLGKTVEIYIPAERIFSTHMKPDEVRLDPSGLWGLKEDSSIIPVDVVFMYPIGGLVLKSPVPAAKNEEALQLIGQRRRDLELKSSGK